MDKVKIAEAFEISRVSCVRGWGVLQKTQATELFVEYLTETATVSLDHSTSRGGRWEQFDTLTNDSVVTLHGETGSAKAVCKCRSGHLQSVFANPVTC